MSSSYQPKTYVRVDRDASDERFEGMVEAWDEELAAMPRPNPAGEAINRARQRLTPELRRAGRIGLAVLAGLGALAGLWVAWQHVLGDPLADTRAYYDAAARLNAGQPLYPANIDPSSNEIYLYPPLLAVVLRPLARLPYEWFAALWEGFVVLTFALTLQRLGVRRRETWIAVGLLGVPIGWALAIAQAHVPMTYLLTVGQPWSIAVAANLKLFPALIALWWLGRRDFQSFAAFLVWSTLLVAAQLVLEPAGARTYFGSIGFEQLGEVRNWSPYTISPPLWWGLLVIGGLAILAAARTRWGWAVAVTVSTLAPPRLLTYMLTGLLAAVRQPRQSGEVDPDDLSDSAQVFVRSAR